VDSCYPAYLEILPIAFLLASPVQTIEQASHDVISECRYTFYIVRNSIVMVITS